jgi:hypothetical protein
MILVMKARVVVAMPQNCVPAALSPPWEMRVNRVNKQRLLRKSARERGKNQMSQEREDVLRLNSGGSSS